MLVRFGIAPLADNYAIELNVFKNVLAELLLTIRIMTIILRLYNFLGIPSL